MKASRIPIDLLLKSVEALGVPEGGFANPRWPAMVRGGPRHQSGPQNGGDAMRTDILMDHCEKPWPARAPGFGESTERHTWYTGTQDLYVLPCPRGPQVYPTPKEYRTLAHRTSKVCTSFG